MAKRMRLQALSFKEELMGEKIDFANRVVYLSLVPWEFCNWACVYCHEGSRRSVPDQLTVEEMRGIIQQAGELGFKSLLLLGGEVLLRATWDVTKEIVQEAYENGLTTLIYTNGSQITEEMARWLAAREVSIALKVDSLREDVYDRLAGKEGAFRSAMKAIELVRSTSIGEVVYENETDKLVRLLFTTVGNALNIGEYASIARFATNNGARWMMESLNHRGSAADHRELAISTEDHSEAMKFTMLLNPEQEHDFHLPCRLFSCVTIRRKGEIGVCPQDYGFMGNVRELGGLRQACDLVLSRGKKAMWRKQWTGSCPIKAGHFYS